MKLMFKVERLIKILIHVKYRALLYKDWRKRIKQKREILDIALMKGLNAQVLLSECLD